jgi:outer membrane cobalamin receptor
MPAPVRVYVNGILRGGIAQLRDTPVNSVERIRYLRPADATTRYGLNQAGGVIEVTLRP